MLVGIKSPRRKKRMTKGSIEVNGVWLETALKAQGSNVRECAAKLGCDPKKIYNHTAGRTYLQFGVLAAILVHYETMNARYVLTGEGSPVTEKSSEHLSGALRSIISKATEALGENT